MVFVLPKGLIISGITTWAARLASALCDRGRVVAVVAYDEAPQHRAIPDLFDPRIQLHRIRGGCPEGSVPDTDHALVSSYRSVLEDLVRRQAQPAVVLPTLSATCFGVLAAISQCDPDLLRVVGWQHNHVAYDEQTMVSYEPLLSRYVGVSHAITERLRERLPLRAGDIEHLPYGVQVPAERPDRPIWNDRPLRLVYTGRLDRGQKRIGALFELSRHLERLGIEHVLQILGDGPARQEVETWCSDCPSIRLECGPAGPAKTRSVLRQADCFVLASRYEGLSVSMLEAMAEGCVPIVTRVNSGAVDAILHGASGMLVEAMPEDEDEVVGRRLAESIASLSAQRLDAMSVAAWERARNWFDLPRHVDGALQVIDLAAKSPARAWPLSRPCVARCDLAGTTSGLTVPADAADRLQGVLDQLAQRAASIALWGAGEHTISLARVLADPTANLIGVIDDDPERVGGHLWGLPIIRPRDAAAVGVTDVIISSWLHEAAIWQRREELERTGINVHRLYAAVPDSEPASPLPVSI